MILFSNVGKENDNDTEKIELYCHYDHNKREFRRGGTREGSEADLVFSF